ncbi:MAG TPA: radical SAM protein [Bryobacteraceae bacterium]|nr:radical SAM protein [Bryobacteraceae bacterium]
MKSILLVSPLFQERHRLFENEARVQRRGSDRAFMAPVSVCTVAALTPPDFHVDIYDENVRGIITEKTQFPRQYDFVGLTGFSSHYQRVSAVSRIFRRRGVMVGIGGPAASTTPERYIDLADVVFIGEAEYIWPAFLQEWKNGKARRIYRQVIKPELEISKPPRWELLGEDVNRYLMGSVQTSRGCPFDCEFCDVPYIFGHRSRWKPVADVIKEIKIQYDLGVRRIFFCDDNFIGDLRYVRSLLQELVVVNKSFPKPVHFFTQMTLNVAKHDDILQMMADANFAGLFIGIETPNKESLKETKKLQNAHTDILRDVHKIQSYGMALWSGVIVGFDHDTPEIFDIQYEFLQASHIPLPLIHLLTAPPGTKLWHRMQKEGRLVAGAEEPVMPKPTTNIIPGGMTRLELLKGHLQLYDRIRDWDAWAERMIGYIGSIERKPAVQLSPEAAARQRRRERLGRILARMEKGPGNLLLETLYRLAKARPQARTRALSVLEPKARKAILRVIRCAMEHAPWMFPETLGPLIIMQLRQVELLRQGRPAMLRQIELESAPGFQLTLAESAEVIPENFPEAYKKLFPDVYQRVVEGLRDKNRIEEVLIEIFTQFVMRWGASLNALEEYHISDIEATCDAVLAEENSHPHTGLVTLGPPPSADFRKTKLPEEVLHSVEQELRLRPGRQEATYAHAGV